MSFQVGFGVRLGDSQSPLWHLDYLGRGNLVSRFLTFIFVTRELWLRVSNGNGSLLSHTNLFAWTQAVLSNNDCAYKVLEAWWAVYQKDPLLRILPSIKFSFKGSGF